jgi:hypothetical protein
MVQGMTAPFSVLVTGDIVIDRNIYEGERATLRDRSYRDTLTLEEFGGAALTHRLIQTVFTADLAERHFQWEATAKKSPEPVAAESWLGYKLPNSTDDLSKAEMAVGTASWGLHPRSNSKDLYWRLSRAFGYGTVRGPVTPDSSITAQSHGLQVRHDFPGSYDALVLDDAGDRFRHKDNEPAWHLGNQQSTLPEWIVLKLTGPIGRGDLWDRLMDCEPSKRLIVILSAALLRRDDVRLSRGLSWERTVEHLLNELSQNPAIQPLRRARHIIVNFECDGAVWIDFSANEHFVTHVVFDAANSEGEWASRISGHTIGYQTCMTASLVQTLASGKKGAPPEVRSAIERGLSAMRNLREEGHGIAVTSKDVSHAGTGFPADRLAKEILHPSQRFAQATLPEQLSDLSRWSILSALQNMPGSSTPLFGFARQFAIHGDSTIDYAPHLRIGKLLTAGRDEMETLRSLRRLMIAYRDTNDGKKPLCIGVFGAPGSGKSFGVEQLAIGVFADSDKKFYEGWMEFNLSQFDTPTELIGAFHQVRDRVLQKFVPVVFWDEFDAQNYKWLKFLLAPMQDGRFQENQITHTLGKCVFVFAGGTAETFEEFGPKAKDPAFSDFKLSKGPDFKSRLDGYLNVLGPNRAGEGDVFYPVRRAILIRNLLGCKSDDRLDIDSGLLTALLEVPTYVHGARSIGKILEPLAVARKRSHASLTRSQLPAPNQLSLHVDAKQLHSLCSRDLPFKSDDIVEKLAPAIHETWGEIARRQGWKAKYDMPFEDLPADIKRSNEAAARRIPDIVALVGLKIVTGAASEDEKKAVRDQLERHLESLAEEEHKGWMANAISEGWRFAEVRDDEKRLHNCLRPFHELSPPDKDKDRNTVQHFLEFAHLAGLKIVFIGTDQ